MTQLHVVDVSEPVLAREDDHHLRKVLRATAGEEVVVTNGAGAWAITEVTTQGLRRVSEVEVDPAPAATTLYLAPIKGERSEWAIAKACELGVATVVPLVSARTIVKVKGEAGQKLWARWRRVAGDAAGQCRRTYDLAVGEPVHVSEVPRDVAVAELGGESDWRGVTSVAIGPEGGWASDEWVKERRRLSLGPSVLRAETAGVVAAALIALQNGGWGFSSGSRELGNDERTK